MSLPQPHKMDSNPEVQGLIAHTYKVKARGEAPVAAFDRWVAAVPAEFRNAPEIIRHTRKMLARVS